MKEFKIKYTEVLAETYTVKAENRGEALAKLKEELMTVLDGPEEIVDTYYSFVEE